MQSHKGYLPITGGDDCNEQGSNPGGAEFFVEFSLSRTILEQFRYNVHRKKRSTFQRRIKHMSLKNNSTV